MVIKYRGQITKKSYDNLMTYRGLRSFLITKESYDKLMTNL